MSDVARTLLLKLLAQADREGKETLPINERSARHYFALTDVGERDALHAYLENAEKAGGLTLEWGKGSEAQDLKRLRLIDADRLAAWLGVTRAASHAEQIDHALATQLVSAPPWLKDTYSHALEQWRLGKLAFRLPASDVSSVTDLFRIAISVCNNEHANLDLRRFSVRLLGDSKAVENLLGKLADLLRNNPEWSQLDNADLFRLLGLEKFPPPLFIKGPLIIDYTGQNWDISTLHPFVGLSPDQVRDVRALGDIPYLLTVENLASFQRHAREVDDDGVVIYTAGFPAPALVRVIQLLDRRLPDSCTFFHWGDRDIGGLRIFSKVAELLSTHSLNPHLMDTRREEERVFSDPDKRLLERCASNKGVEGGVARCWLKNNLGPMEQEATDPQPPQLSADVCRSVP